MRKLLISLFAFVCARAVLVAQTNNISLYVYAPEQTEEVPQASMDYLVNRLCTAIVAEGLAAQDERMTQFVLLPKVNVVSKNVIANTQQQVVLSLDVTLQVVDYKSGTTFASTTLNLKGVGTNEVKAYQSAFSSLRSHNGKLQSLTSTAKQKILVYYDTEADHIIKQANLLARQKHFDEAFYLLSMIPSQCSKFDNALATGLDIWKSYNDHSCSMNLAKAQSAWMAGQDYEAANKAGHYLALILPDADCYGDALQLYKEIKKKVGDLWKFEMSVYKDENALRLAKVKAMQEIGAAYGKGQQPNLVIYKSKY